MIANHRGTAPRPIAIADMTAMLGTGVARLYRLPGSPSPVRAEDICGPLFCLTGEVNGSSDGGCGAASIRDESRATGRFPVYSQPR
jgi:hypothetical protein